MTVPGLGELSVSGFQSPWLFVFVRAPGGGPPLAVKRLNATLPQDVDLSSSDAMVAGRSVEAGQNVSVVARISAFVVGGVAIAIVGWDF